MPRSLCSSPEGMSSKRGVLHMEEGEHDWKGESRKPGTPREQLPEARAPVRLVGFQSHLWASFEQSTSCPVLETGWSVGMAQPGS